MTEPRTHLRIERLMSAAIEDVFAAWTDPRSMAQWLSPGGRAEVEADVRPGGRLRVVMIGEGIRIEHTGEYLTVDAPQELSFTWRSQYAGNDSVVTVSLTPRGDETLMVLVHERLPSEAVESHEGGWSGIIGRLEAVLKGSR